MSVLVVRHALSEANDKDSPAFGRGDAPLKDFGIVQAMTARDILAAKHGIDPATITAAASEMLRSQQTATVIGFTAVNNYAVLNEVHTPKTPELRVMMDRGEIIDEARRAAELVLTNPPAEEIWFTHGYLIAALSQATGIDTSGLRFIPRFCEIRELPIEQG
jgi:broad specificity phosphatase PhoE